MGIHRRWPLYMRPFFFVAGMALLVVGILWGPNWDWDWSLQTGTIFLQILVPTEIFVFNDVHLLFQAFGVAGLAIVGILGLMTRARAIAQLEDPPGFLFRAHGRFYPFPFLLGLFLCYFGVYFLFSITVAADETPNGFITFVYFDYAGIAQRGLVSIIGVVVLVAGLASLGPLSLSLGLGGLEDGSSRRTARPPGPPRSDGGSGRPRPVVSRPTPMSALPRRGKGAIVVPSKPTVPTRGTPTGAARSPVRRPPTRRAAGP